MPELPEVEVVKLFLADRLIGQTITDLQILNSNSFVGDQQQVIGQKVTHFSRLGKQLSIHLNNDLILLVHLKMTGQLIIDGRMLGHPTKDVDSKSTRLIFTFHQGTRLYFNDQRKFGWVHLLTPAQVAASQLALGHDIFDPHFTPEYLHHQLSRTRRPVKVALLDQHFFAGIGNIYANDALFLSGIHPLTIAHSITLHQSQILHRHLIAIMQQSVLAGGSTTKDKKYLRPDNSHGQNQFFFRVYERKGEPCLVCSTPIQYLKVAGRGTFYCPHCQNMSVIN